LLVHCATCDAQWASSQVRHAAAVPVLPQSLAHVPFAQVSSTSASSALSGESAASHAHAHAFASVDEKQAALQERNLSQVLVPAGTPPPPGQDVEALCLNAQSARALQSCPAGPAQAMNTVLARQSVAQVLGYVTPQPMSALQALEQTCSEAADAASGNAPPSLLALPPLAPALLAPLPLALPLLAPLLPPSFPLPLPPLDPLHAANDHPTLRSDAMTVAHLIPVPNGAS
jgi:hypothetical protein